MHLLLARNRKIFVRNLGKSGRIDRFATSILTTSQRGRLSPVEVASEVYNMTFSNEPLETRVFLDATAVLGGHGVFKVTGTDNGETIEISLDSGGTNVQASVDGTVIGTAAVSDVKAIVVNAGAGDDTVTVDSAITQRLFVSGGDGNDTITVNSPKGAIYGGAGNDTISTTGSGPYAINGGADNDTITSGDGNNYI